MGHVRIYTHVKKKFIFPDKIDPTILKTPGKKYPLDITVRVIAFDVNE